jgi:hypothetical protein
MKISQIGMLALFLTVREAMDVYDLMAIELLRRVQIE